MKKLTQLCLLIITTCCFVSCDNNMTWDIAPVYFTFNVQDANGNDLLDPNTENNILDNDIKVVFEDKEYPKDVDMTPTENTKFYMAVLKGLYTVKYDDDDYHLEFGQFMGSEDHDKSFVIHWGDGTHDEVSFVHDYKFRVNKPKISTKIFLNGKESNNRFVIVK